MSARLEGLAEGSSAVHKAIRTALPAIRGKIVEGFARAIQDGFLTLEKTVDRAAKVKPPARIVTAPELARAKPAISAATLSVAAGGEEKKLTKAARAILSVLANFPDAGATMSKVALMSGYSIKSSSFSGALSELRVAGLLVSGQPLRLNAEGRAAAGEGRPLLTGEELLHYWLGHSALGRAEREILKPLVQALPGAMSKENLAELSGYSITSSSFSGALSTLRSLELISGRGDELRAAEEFA